MRRFVLLIIALACLFGCARLSEVGKAPTFTPIQNGLEHQAMVEPSTFDYATAPRERGPSLWNAGRQSLLGDRRASTRGDIMTVVIEIDESAEISNSTQRSRSGAENLQVPNLLGVPELIERIALPNAADFDNAANATSSSSSAGDGSVRRDEKLTLRVAATVVDVLQNGVLRIRGSQEVRVNFEIRELLVDGYVRPEDISRRNEITYDKIASARISYGGRGQITDVQQPRYGQQIADIVLPF
ncbi:MAG: flagellar basal body L-ring protein FlgH [Pseudomonadota bacterium]